jgi:signal peptidase I
MSDLTRSQIFKLAIREYIETILVVIVIAFLLRFFVLAAYKIPTASMEPTLRPGDFVFSYQLAYGIPIPLFGGHFAQRQPERGEVAVLQFPSRPGIDFVKRVIGLPGDRILIQQGQLFINDEKAVYSSGSVPADSGAPFVSAAPAVKLAQEFELIPGGHRHQVIRNSKASVVAEFGPYIVPPQQVFVLGDNRDVSEDSRELGVVPISSLQGEVLIIWFSIDASQNSTVPVRWDRIFSRVR